MTSVTLSETYDLSTKVNKMSMVAIHTPSMALLRKTYPGLILNNRFCKLVKCDVKLACASVLPADPLAVGVSAGKVAPQDMFNPILYKAVSNRGMGNFTLRMHGLTEYPTSAIKGESVVAIDENVNPSQGAPADDFGLYYSLLANHKGWKIAHPQSGLSMRGLKPFVYEKYYDIGEDNGSTTEAGNGSVPVIGNEGTSSNPNAIAYATRQSMFGKAHPMPGFNTLFLNPNSDLHENVSDDWLSVNSAPKIMPVYCGLIVLPPAKLHILYYRLVVRWTVRFFGIRPVSELQSLNNMSAGASIFYGTDYEEASRGLDSFTEMVDTKDAEITKIMEGA